MTCSQEQVNVGKSLKDTFGMVLLNFILPAWVAFLLTLGCGAGITGSRIDTLGSAMIAIAQSVFTCLWNGPEARWANRSTGIAQIEHNDGDC